MNVLLGLSSMFLGDVPLEEVTGAVEQNPSIKVLDAWYDTPCHLLEPADRRSSVVDAIKAAKARLGFETVSHACAFDVNPVAYNPAMQRACLVEARESLLFAAAIDSKHVTLHGGWNVFDAPCSRHDVKLLESFIDTLLAFIDEQGLDIVICVENDAPTNRMSRPFESIDVLAAVLERFPAVHLTLDIAHAARASRDAAALQVRGNRLDLTTMERFLQEHGHRVRVIHASWPGKHRTHDRIPRDNPAAIRTLNAAWATPAIAGIVEYEQACFTTPAVATGAVVEDITWLETTFGGNNE